MGAKWDSYMMGLQDALKHAVKTGMSARAFVISYREKTGDIVHSAHAIEAQVHDIVRLMQIPATPEFRSDLRRFAAEEHRPGSTTRPTSKVSRTRKGPTVTFSREDVASLFGQDPKWVTAHRESLGLVVVTLQTAAGIAFGYTAESVEAAMATHEQNRAPTMLSA